MSLARRGSAGLRVAITAGANERTDSGVPMIGRPSACPG